MAIVKDLGMVTAYAYAVAGGYEGTEAEFTEMLGQAGITLAQLENLTAVATTLSEGSEATASYADGVLTFGIPKGDTGATGPQGEQGVKGDTGNGIVSIAKTGTSGLVDTYTITFTDGTTTTFTVTNGADGDITNVAQAFDATKAYSAGDMVLYQGTLYVFTAAHAAGAWVGSDAQAVILTDEVTALKDDLSNLDDAVYSNIIREIVPYPFGTSLNNAYVWVATSVYVPKGLSGILTCANLSTGINQGKTLHVIKLLENANTSYTVLSDTVIESDFHGVNIYISKTETSTGNVYVGFYSVDNGICYQTSGDRRTSFKRCEYSNVTVGETVTLGGTFSMDFAFGLAVTVASGGKKSYVVVDASGNGDYTSVYNAINNEPENTVIYINPGIYEQDMTACLKKRIILIGADRNQCIIRDTDGRYGHHPLYVSCGYFENLTIEAPYISGTSQEVGVSDLGAYAVHIDTDEDYSVGKTTEFHHCTIRSDFFPAVGLGMRKDATYIFDDCELINGQITGRGDYSDEGTLGALYFHDSNGVQGNQYIILKDNVFKSNLKYALCPYQATRNPQNNRVYCDFINNVLYSDVGKYTDTVWFRGDPFNVSTGIFSVGIGYGNSINTLNNV